MAQNLQSYPEYSNIENRYRGLFARIHGAIGKLNRKSSDSISPRTP